MKNILKLAVPVLLMFLSLSYAHAEVRRADVILWDSQDQSRTQLLWNLLTAIPGVREVEDYEGNDIDIDLGGIRCSSQASCEIQIRQGDHYEVAGAQAMALANFLRSSQNGGLPTAFRVRKLSCEKPYGRNGNAYCSIYLR